MTAGRRQIVPLVCSLVLLGLLIGIAFPQEQDAPPAKISIPSEPRVREIRSLLDETLELAKATTPVRKKAALRKLLELAADPATPPDELYVVLQTALPIARDVGDAAATLQLVPQFVSRFENEEQAASTRLYLEFLRETRSGTGVEPVIEALILVIRQEVAEHRYQEAQTLRTAVAKEAGRLAARSPVKTLAEMDTALKRRADAYAEQEEARKRLQQDEKNVDANRIVARWFILHEKDWEQALPFLVRTGEGDWSFAARLELDTPDDGAKRLSLADAWWTVAEKADKAILPAVQQHTLEWYEQAAPDVTSPLLKKRIAQRTEELTVALKGSAGRDVLALAAGSTPAAPKTSSRYAPGEVKEMTPLKVRFCWCPPGDFEMGSLSSEVGRKATEGAADGKQVRVTIDKGFWMGQTEVTQGQWAAVMGSNPSAHTQVAGEDTSLFPVERVSWYDAVEFCNKLSAQLNQNPYYQMKNVERSGGSIRSATVSLLGGKGFRLPTEPEWEYACRAGTTTPFHFGERCDGTQANVNGTAPYGGVPAGPSLGRTTAVGRYEANAFGLKDMHGNVFEWCQDPFEPHLAVKTGPLGEASGKKVLRGGSWYNGPAGARSATRGDNTPDFRTPSDGFRVARSQ